MLIKMMMELEAENVIRKIFCMVPSRDLETNWGGTVEKNTVATKICMHCT